MTDIIELTQRMREAAENATRGEWIKENGDGWEAICCDDDQANGNFIIAKFLGPDKARNREFVQAVQPQNIRTLCDAIAQRDAQNSELRVQIAALTAENVALMQRIDWPMEQCPTTGAVTAVDPADFIPATDAAANALRAEGVEMFGDSDYCPAEILAAVNEFANQLREGK
ncbi:ead/Ea22-like family protein [Mixta calida]|uniref:ead/Ea22-like family protein n=1 Tax=Mixta calida TaxID=665913 RepID=UPI0028A9D5E7|nr:ead/Ea22-like family protein [Mixta calida]